MRSTRRMVKKNAPLLAAIVFGLLLTVTLLQTGQHWYQDWALTHHEPSRQTVSSMQSQATKLIRAIPERHLFGRWIQVGNNVPVTSLELRITGTVKGVGKNSKHNGEPSKVYISISGQPSKIYEEGDVLPSGVKIYDITPTMVIIENNGELEKLPLPRDRLQFAPVEKREP